MEDLDFIRPFRFHWTVRDPFLPFEATETVINIPSTSLKQWKVILEPVDRFSEYVLVAFRLLYLPFDEDDRGIMCHSLEVAISSKQREVIQKDTNYFFDEVNCYKYGFQTSVHCDTHEICVQIEISPLHKDKINQEENVLVIDEDLTQLSDDLNQLFRSQLYSDLRLLSTDPDSNFPVHSCMMHARWSNFFDTHEVIENGVETSISPFVLLKILNYMYSGRIPTVRELLYDEYYTELLQVIDEYKLDHLYLNFAKDDSQQHQNTHKEMFESSTNFFLDDDVIGSPLNPRFNWTVNESSANEILVRFKFSLLDDPPTFAFWMFSKSPHHIFAEVRLRFTTLEEAKPRPKVKEMFLFHVCDYLIPPAGKASSGTCRFRETKYFNDFIQRQGRKLSLRGSEEKIEETVFRYFILCELRLSEGINVMRVNFESSVKSRLWERFSVLSNHMSQLLSRGTEADLKVQCPTKNPNHQVDFLIHKAIFAARVRNWRNVVQEVVPEGNDIPDVVTCNLRGEAFRYVLKYIYSGKILNIPIPLLDEIQTFAVKGGFSSRWQTVLNRMKCASQNRQERSE